MKLVRLKVLVDDELIREIKFLDGLNLVLNKRGVGRSGNSVGKTTLARVVDYLFMGSIGPIYIDEEFKKPNEKIESLFLQHKVSVELEFIGLDDRLHIISRNLRIEPKEREFRFDGQLITEAFYEQALKEKLLDVTTQRPSVRFVLPKFIRNDSHKMLNTTKFLDQHASAKDYGEIFLYLFGFGNTSLLTEKREAANSAAKRKKQSAALNAIVREQKPSTEIAKYKVETQKLERDFLSFDYSPRHENPVGRLSELQTEEDRVMEAALDVSRKIYNINRTVQMLGRQGGNYLVNEARAIYEFAGIAIEGAIKDYEELLAFHDKLVARKKQFLEADLPELFAMKSAKEEELAAIRRAKLDVFADLRSEESISKITEDLKALGELKVKLGRLEGLLEQQKIASSELDAANERLKKVLAKISKELEAVNEFGEVFNKHFKRITDLTHAEPYEFELRFNDETGVCDIDIKNKVSNPEGGKKKAEVIAFDMAYIETVAELRKRRPTFVFHDSIEDIDQKQIDTIFTLSRSMPGQQIVSMLSDKLTDEMYRKYIPDAILLLSDEDMFFKI